MNSRIGVGVAALVVAIGIAGASAQEKAPPAPVPAQPAPAKGVDMTAAKAVAAMPAGCESVMVRRFDLLAAEGSHQKVMLAHELDMYKSMATGEGELGQMPGSKDPWDQVMGRVVAHKPTLHALGGSGFKKPRDLGMGLFKEREVWVCGESLGEDLAAWAAQLPGVTTDGEGAARVLVMTKVDPEYNTKKHEQQTYVAFIGDRVVVRGSTAEEARGMVAALYAANAPVPPRWAKVVDDQTLAAPLFVLRAFDPAREEENWQLAKPVAKDAAHPHQLRFVLRDVKDTAPEVRVVTSDREKCRTFVEDAFESTPMKETDDGFTSVKRAEKPSPSELEDAKYLYLKALFAMGVYIAI